MSKPATKLVTVAKTETITPSQQRASEAAASVIRFQAFHGAAKGSAMALKLAKFFAGVEVQTLCDLHKEEHGETRGGDQKSDTAKTKRTGLSILTLADFLEDALDVTDRTARRYRQFFESVTQEKPELAAKLRKWWLSWKEKAALELAPGAAPKALGKGKGKGKGKGAQLVTTGPATMALHEACGLAAKDVQALVEHADEFGLHELFERPLKNVTPDDEPPAPPPADKDALAKFWLKDFQRRAMNNEFLKLPKQSREALLATWEEATTKLKDSLKK